ncbi:MAG TPA: hypothetical protein VM183_03825 [Burkholderiales bacterium]|nr:hypothetical protein [Burkholderiales bacterium]
MTSARIAPPQAAPDCGMSEANWNDYAVLAVTAALIMLLVL